MKDVETAVIDETKLINFQKLYSKLLQQFALLKIVLVGLFIMLFSISFLDAFINLGQYPEPLQLQLNLVLTITTIAVTVLAIIAVKHNLSWFAFFAYPAGIFSIIDEHNHLVLVLNMTLAIAMYEVATLGGFFQKTIKNYSDYKDVHELERAAQVFSESFKHQMIVFIGLLLMSWVVVLAFEVITFSFGPRLESTISLVVIMPMIAYVIYITIIKKGKPRIYEEKEEEFAKAAGKFHHAARRKGI
ncbi:MAG: hypothetical protein ACXAEU_05440 [Candidatus Hodarchaeales archaeon]|jgi:hypothetical protein